MARKMPSQHQDDVPSEAYNLPLPEEASIIGDEVSSNAADRGHTTKYPLVEHFPAVEPGTAEAKAVIPPPCWNGGRYKALEMYKYLESLPQEEKEKVMQFLKSGRKVEHKQPGAVPINELPHQSLEDLAKHYEVNL